MMRKVVDDRNPIDDGTNLEPALDALEARQRLKDGVGRHALARSKRGSAGGIQRIVLAGHGQAEFAKSSIPARECPAGERSFVTQTGDPPIRIRSEAVTLNRTKRLSYAFADIFTTVKSNDAPTPWNKVHKTPEGSLHRGKVGIDIGVIELNVRED